MSFLPPDTKSETEWWLLMFVVNALTGIRSGWGVAMLVVAVFLVIVYAIGKLFLIALTRLWDIYQTRGHSSSLSARMLKVAGVIVVILWAIALTLANSPRTFGMGMVLFTGSLFAFTILYEVIDWLEERKQTQQAAALPEDISLEDIISWRSTRDHVAVGGKTNE